MAPYLTAKLAGKYVAVDAAGLLFSTLQVVLLPVLVGAFLNQYFQSLVKFVSPVMPPIAVATVGVLCGNAAQSSSAILMSGKQVVLASALLHASGFFFGYIFSRMLGLDVTSSRTISIDVGMQLLGFLRRSKKMWSLVMEKFFGTEVCGMLFICLAKTYKRRTCCIRHEDVNKCRISEVH